MADPRPMSNDPRTDLDARLEAEIQAALGDMSIEDMLDERERPGSPGAAKSDRTTKTGTIVAVTRSDVIVEFGPRVQGVCELTHFDEPPTVGARMDFVLERLDKHDNLWVLSRRGAIQKAAWENLEVGQIVEARCTGVNKGGLEMEVASHRAFMPAGQVDLRHIENLSVFIGEKMPCEIIELDKRTGRIILSRRSFLEADRAAKREELLSKLEVGQEVPGVVVSVQPFGCFVDIGGLDGLVHVSDLSYKRISHPKEVVKEGDQINVRILRIDDTQDPPRLSLGLKQTMADPFQTSANELVEGGTVTGRVTKIMPFGAFVEISPGVEGLIHISEIAHDRVHDVSRHLKVDEIVTVKVLSVDLGRQRISLSLKALKSQQEAEAPRASDKAMERLRAKFGGGKGLKGGIG